MTLMDPIKGLSTKQAFTKMLDNPDIDLKDKKVLRHRANNGKISLEKMIELLKGNGFEKIQDQVWIEM